MAEQYVGFRVDAHEQLRIALTPAGEEFAREDLGLRFGPDEELPQEARARYQRFGAERALAELLGYQLANGRE
jgi:hypothetical protein